MAGKSGSSILHILICFLFNFVEKDLIQGIPVPKPHPILLDCAELTDGITNPIFRRRTWVGI